MESTRKLRIREKGSKKIVLDLDMKSCDIIFMSGDFQKEFTHEIPKQLKIKEPRYSFTFRHHKK
jgi:alkylated DNA repair dioxygenase AlkB